MSNPNQLYLNVPLCEPAPPDVQALAACRYVLDEVLKTAPNAFEQQRMVVAWLAETFLEK